MFIISFVVRLKDSRPVVEAFSVNRIYLAQNKEELLPEYRVRFCIRLYSYIFFYMEYLERNLNIYF